jgi:uncharacterized protein (DUF433 family)
VTILVVVARERYNGAVTRPRTTRPAAPSDVPSTAAAGGDRAPSVGPASARGRTASLPLPLDLDTDKRPPSAPVGLLPPVRVAHPHVVVAATMLAGSPTIAGTRVPVRRLWAWHKGGTSVETLMRRYPQLGPARVLDALSFAYDNEELVEADLSREVALLDKTITPSQRSEARSVAERPRGQQVFPFVADPAASAPGRTHPPSDAGGISSPRNVDGSRDIGPTKDSTPARATPGRPRS